MSSFFNDLSEDEVNELIAEAREEGMIIPRSHDAIKLAYVLIHSPMGMAHTVWNEEGEVITEGVVAGTCMNGCCVSMGACPDSVRRAARFMGLIGGEEVEDAIMKRGAWREVITVMQ